MSTPTQPLKVEVSAVLSLICQEFTSLNQYPVTSGEALNLAMATSLVVCCAKGKKRVHCFLEFQYKVHTFSFDAHIFIFICIFMYMFSEKQSKL